MTVTESRADPELPLSGPFWFARRIWRYARAFAVSMLPCPDLASRWRMRRAAGRLVTLRMWPCKQATSADAAAVVARCWSVWYWFRQLDYPSPFPDERLVLIHEQQFVASRIRSC